MEPRHWSERVVTDIPELPAIANADFGGFLADELISVFEGD